MTPPPSDGLPGPDDHLRERTLESRVAYQGSFLTVLHDKVGLPDGRTASREYICLLYTSPSPRD